jgi:hypothetical protein
VGNKPGEQAVVFYCGIILFVALTTGSLDAAAGAVLLVLLQLPVHEFFHVIVAWACRLRILGLRIGGPPNIASFAVGPVPVTVGALVLDGSVRIGATSRNGLRARIAATTLAGPVLTIAVLALAYNALPAETHMGVIIAILINASNLLPLHGTNSTGQAGKTDGYTALDAIFGSFDALASRFVLAPSAAAVPRTKAQKVPAPARQLLRELGAGHDRGAVHQRVIDQLKTRYGDLYVTKVALAHVDTHLGKALAMAPTIEALFNDLPDDEWRAWSIAALSCASADVGRDALFKKDATVGLHWAKRATRDPDVAAKNHHNMAWALLDNGDPDGARRELALDRGNPREPLTNAARRYWTHAMIHARLGEIAEAVDNVQLVRRYEPDSPLARDIANFVIRHGIETANNEHNAHDYKAMATTIDLLLRVDGDEPVVLLSSVHARAHLHPRSAIDALRRLANTRPSFSEAWFDNSYSCAAAEIALDALEHDDAGTGLEWTRIAMSRTIEPDFMRPLLAWALAQHGNTAEARQELAQCPPPGRPDPREEGVQWAMRAGAHNALGELDAGKQCVERAKELAPESDLVALVSRVVSAKSDRSASTGH